MGIRQTLVALTVEEARSLLEADPEEDQIFERLDELLDREDSDDRLDLDKTWHGLHFLLTGTAWEGVAPACFLVRGGQELLPDEGEGTTRILSVEEVRSFAGLLAGLSEAAVRARFSPDLMMELGIYPTIWDRPIAEDDTCGWLVEAFKALSAFVASAAERSRPVLVSP